MLKLSLVTPSFNQAAFIEKTLASVRSQSILPFEHLIYDPGSTDGSLDIVRTYQKANPFARIHVGRDKSQTHAINLGYAESTGDILSWLNTDDRYASPNVLERVLRTFNEHPEIDIVYGRGIFVDPDGTPLRDVFIHTDPSVLKERFLNSVGILQPALFMRRRVFELVGPLNEDLHFCFDYEYWIRAAKTGAIFRFLDEQLCEAVLHIDSKTMGQRAASLAETARMIRSQFGFASVPWLRRLADAELTGADGILHQTRVMDEAIENKLIELFIEYNGDRRTAGRILSMSDRIEAKETVKLQKELIPKRDFYVATAFDSSFFHSGLTMIAQISKQSTKSWIVFIYDLGLKNQERSILEAIKNVYVLDLPRDNKAYFDGYFSPETYGFKSYAARHAGSLVAPGSSLIWMDAGIAPIKDIGPILDVIADRDILLIDHDDKGGWPFFNITFTTDECIEALDASNDELLSPHVRAGLFGYKVSGRFQRLIEESFRVSKIRAAIAGEKHAEQADNLSRPTASMSQRKRVREDVSFRKTLKRGEIRKLFGFLGHRHDQAILSILASRYGAPIQSARSFCVADEASSARSKQNWTKKGPNNRSAPFAYEPEAFYAHGTAICMQHRGAFLNHQGLDFGVDPRERAIILGNGPSLKGFDFARFKGFAVFGMNAAYRYWDRIGWYPQFYSCLDVVLGASHADEIKRLIENAHTYGIRRFLLRQRLIEAIGEVRNSDRVISFDLLTRGAKVLSGPTLSTGSHTAAWAAYMGYERIFLLGIDCNYVEVIDGAVRGKGTELQIVQQNDENPNYFFSDYQRVGDKYNVPNPGREIHLVSWREVAERLPATNASILNANLKSKVDAFDFCRFEEVESGQPVTIIPRHRVLGDGAYFAPTGFASVGIDRTPPVQFDEPGAVFHLLRERASNGVMIDVGAHHGGTCLRFVRAGWRVFAFEPDPANRAKLAKNLSRKANVVISEEAVADTSGRELPFYASEESTGISGLSAFRDSHREVARVKTITLDDVVARHGLSAVDFLKIDVEGFEMAVLRGLDFGKLSPDVVLAEFEDDKTRRLGYGAHDLGVFLVDRGYTVYVSEWYPIEHYGAQHSFRRIARYPCSIPNNSWGNLIAFKTDPTPDTLKRAIRVATNRPIAFEGDEASLITLAPNASGNALKGSPEPVKAAAAIPLRSSAQKKSGPGQLHQPSGVVAGKTPVAARPKKPKPDKAASAAGGSAKKARKARGRRGKAVPPKKQRRATRSREGVFQTWPVTIAAIGVALVLFALAAGVSASGGTSPALILAAAVAVLALVMLGILHDASKRQLDANRNAARVTAKELKTRMHRGERTLRRKLKRARKTAGSRHAAAQKALGSVRAEMGSLKTTLGAQVAEVRKELVQDRAATKAALEATRADVAAIGSGTTASLAGLAAQQHALRVELATASDASKSALEAQNELLTEALGEQRAELMDTRSALGRFRDRDVSLDIMSALRALRGLILPDAPKESPAASPEHGHLDMMVALVNEFRNGGQPPSGRMLIEIGTTRERIDSQGSTEKLAVFTGLLGMRFVTVDMDPANTARARRIIRQLNPSAEAVTAKGEDYLAAADGPFDYVYLDAFDFDHGKHSDARRSRYRENLGTDISDEACWQMHLECARHIAAKMRKHGIVVIDDTWTGEDGAFAGKGKLAVPHLLASGFALVAQTPRTVTLRRGQGSDELKASPSEGRRANPLPRKAPEPNRPG